MDQHDTGSQIIQTPKPIKWVIPDSIRTDHATHIVVQQNGSEFTLLFFEVQPLLFMGTPEEQLDQYEKLPYTEAKCIAKIVMSAENIAEATNNLVQGLNRLNEMLQASMKGQENVDPTKRTELSTAS